MCLSSDALFSQTHIIAHVCFVCLYYFVHESIVQYEFILCIQYVKYSYLVKQTQCKLLPKILRCQNWIKVRLQLIC